MSAKLYYIYQQGIKGPYKGKEKGFFNVKDQDWSKLLESSWQEILTELKTNQKEQFTTNEVSRFQSETDSWQTIGFMFWSRQHKSKLNAFPKTASVLKQIPGLIGASINKLAAGAEILEHKGETNAIYRCHLGLIVPGKLPEIGFEVNNVSKEWNEGEVLAFCDAHRHKAWNNTDKDRFILLLDILRPEFLHKKYDICCTVLSLNTLHLISEKLNWTFLYRLTSNQLKILTLTLKPLWYLYLPIHRFIGQTIK